VEKASKGGGKKGKAKAKKRRHASRTEGRATMVLGYELGEGEAEKSV